MARRPRRNHSPAFKARVAVAAVQGENTLIGLAQDFDLHPQQIKQWRDQLLDGAAGVFGAAPKAEAEPAAEPAAEPVIDVKTLHAKIGELTLERDFLSGAPGPGRVCRRAQEDDRSRREAQCQPSGACAGDQPGRRLLSSPPGLGGRSEADAPDRQAGHGIPLRGEKSAKAHLTHHRPSFMAPTHTVLSSLGENATFFEVPLRNARNLFKQTEPLLPTPRDRRLPAQRKPVGPGRNGCALRRRERDSIGCVRSFVDL